MASQEDFRDFLHFLSQQREDLLGAQLMKNTNFFKGNENEIYLYWLHEKSPEAQWITRVAEAVSRWAGKKISVYVQAPEDSTVSWESQELRQKTQQTEQLLKHPLVQKMQSVFPGLKDE
ncbi:DNA polymerase III subunits gamma and tau [Holospora elegans E1]|uniref:DNA polymerase III subunits gamma and tau n=1 Tax=Holospora elegans E1 TaxID=1427503 RepID=A0A023DZH5_9PROT|nr:hypothetical protein [Holospora elegans]GAJ46420.1 DNA polymerase III subunits gamma and tau [Holospora elegans E1]